MSQPVLFEVVVVVVVVVAAVAAAAAIFSFCEELIP
jgi:hypothetical protein